MPTANIFGHDVGKRPIPILVDSMGRIITATSGDVQTYIDEVDANNTYIGESASGSLPSVSVWLIKKVVVTGVITTINFADSDPSFNKKWDDRALYIY